MHSHAQRIVVQGKKGRRGPRVEHKDKPGPLSKTRSGKVDQDHFPRVDQGHFSRVDQGQGSARATRAKGGHGPREELTRVSLAKKKSFKSISIRGLLAKY